MLAVHTVYRRHCLDRRWPARARTGRQTPPRRSSGGLATSSPYTELRVMHGPSGRVTAITKSSSQLPNVNRPRDSCHSLFRPISAQWGLLNRHTRSLTAPGVCDGCPERRVALNLRHICAPLPRPGVLSSAGSAPGGSRAHKAPDQRLSVSARHKRKRNLFTHNLKLSKTTIAK